MSERAVAPCNQVLENRVSGIVAGGEAKLDDGAWRLIDCEHSRQRIAAGFDRMVMSEHGRLELRFPRARVIAVGMAQNIVVEACNGGIAFASIRPGKFRDWLIEVGGRRFSLAVPFQSPEIAPRLATDAQHPRADSDTEAHTGCRDDSADNGCNFHDDLSEVMAR